MKYEIIKQLLHKENSKIKEEDLVYIYDSTTPPENIWRLLINLNLEKTFNTVITAKCLYSYIDFNKNFTETEKNEFKDLSPLEIEIKIIINLTRLLENNFNEMIKNEFDLLNINPKWTCIKLDNLYTIDLIGYTEKNEKTKKNLKKKIENINLIISTLERINGVIFYSRTNKRKYPSELTENINFTKGYLLCLPDNIIITIKNYKYTRKMIKRYPEIITQKKELNFIESLKNENYNNPIWLKNESLASITNLNNYTIHNKNLLYEKSYTEKIINSLNFLNSIRLAYNKKILKTLKYISENTEKLNLNLISRHRLKKEICIINESKKHEEIGVSDLHNKNAFINSAACLDIIEKQLNYYRSFYLNHRLDSRIRLYCLPWPINYQLSHIVRVSLVIKKKIKIEKIVENLKKHKILSQYIKNEYNFLEHTEVENNKLQNIFKILNIKNHESLEEKLKKEFIFIQIINIAPKSLKSIEEKINFTEEIIKDFLKANLKIEWAYWLDKLKIKNKKLPYLILYQKSLKELSKNVFNTIFWADASSNAIQLITLRLKIKNEKLLMLTNIINNTTEYENIYEYITEKIKKKKHDKLVNELNNKISESDINFLQEIDLNKYLLMPLSYGMGKISYREYTKLIIEKDPDKKKIWDELSLKEQNKISDYFWEKACEILKEIDLNIDEYKKICNNFWKKNNSECFIWKTDIETPIAPISLKTSKRAEILAKINENKLKLKEILNNETKKNILKKIENLEKKLKKDEKIFWKRAMIKTNNQNIFIRIYHPYTEEINIRETRQALIPNTIHCYDASILHEVIRICKEVEIEILVIHDSIGCHPLLAPYIKAIFKIVNIEFLKKNKINNPFPIDKNLKIEEYSDDIYEKILKSKKFFR